MILRNSKLSAVLLPGFGCDLDSMLELDHAINEFPSVSHTRCELFTSEVSLDEMACKVVKQYSDSELLLFGFSMGGWVAQEVASRMRSQVKGLVMISSWSEAPFQYLQVIHSLYNDLRSGKELDSFRSIVEEGFINKKTSHSMANRWLSMAKRIGPDTFLRQIKAILERPDVSENIPNIQCPILAIAGAEDTLLKPSEQFEYVQHHNKCETEILDLCGHNLIWERPLALSKTVYQWLHLNLDLQERS
ncbi:putative aminoacrylate hydrolase RutD [Synechococcus sp. MIT S9509]|uniref:alpha/beta fold hydrolase n=1 Tax=Synechococcus sp. MIT S9509 TaxID=1801630 RepID=UPI0007BC7A74|nr:alpha/beta hydrolase [Synechococcus sp. MIT S9509]KZR92747.1 putative aminoacrylate hydrolase RutD [Synechococcus sp. MIT S9509]